MSLVLVLHASFTLIMVGVIWFVQLVHYPLMAQVGAVRFGGYERQHARRTAWVVALPMLGEATTAVLLLWRIPGGSAAWPAWLGLGLLVLIWASTAFLQVPCHRELESGFDEKAHRRLVLTNWIRTAAWSGRGILVLWMLWRG